MSETRAALIWCAFPTQNEARAVAETLLAERLIACANIIPGVVSLFWWQDEIEAADEVAMLCKTSALQLAAASTRLAKLHPYDVPAVSGWIADEAPDAMRQWLAETTGERAASS